MSQPDRVFPASPVRMEDALHDARRALTCLYIAVDESVADDVNAKVRNALQALTDRITALEQQNAQLTEERDALQAKHQGTIHD
jgi:FtsZ-binding cell division protein ZapB